MPFYKACIIILVELLLLFINFCVYFSQTGEAYSRMSRTKLGGVCLGSGLVTIYESSFNIAVPLWGM